MLLHKICVSLSIYVYCWFWSSLSFVQTAECHHFQMHEAAVPWRVRNPDVWLYSHVPTTAPASSSVSVASPQHCCTWFLFESWVTSCIAELPGVICPIMDDTTYCWSQLRFGLGNYEARLGFYVSGHSRLHQLDPDLGKTQHHLWPLS